MGPWLHYDHAEDGTYLGFSHGPCNRKAGARKGAAMVNKVIERAQSRRW